MKSQSNTISPQSAKEHSNCVEGIVPIQESLLQTKATYQQCLVNTDLLQIPVLPLSGFFDWSMRVRSSGEDNIWSPGEY